MASPCRRFGSRDLLFLSNLAYSETTIMKCNVLQCIASSLATTKLEDSLAEPFERRIFRTVSDSAVHIVGRIDG